MNHSKHGRGTIEGGPDSPDCACCRTPMQDECADSGCCFCLASRYFCLIDMSVLPLDPTGAERQGERHA